MKPIYTETNWQEALQHTIELAGPQATFFAQHQAGIIASIAKMHGIKPTNILDYGCGDGTMSFLLSNYLPKSRIHGADSDRQLIEIAGQWYGKPTLRYNLLREALQTTYVYAKATPHRQGERFRNPSTAHLKCPTKLKVKTGVSRDYNLIYLANVIHHIPKHEHKKIIALLEKQLAPNGLLIILEFNPYNMVQAWRFYRDPQEKGNRMIWPNYIKKLMTSYDNVKTHFFKNDQCLPQALSISRYMPSTSLYSVVLQKN